MVCRLRGVVVSVWAAMIFATAVHAGPLEDAAREARRPLIVRFGLDRCLQCIKQSQAFEVLAPKYEGELVFRAVHIVQEEEMVGAYKVLLIPTVLFFDAAGNEVFRHVGYLDPAQLEAEFRKADLTVVAAGG